MDSKGALLMIVLLAFDFVFFLAALVSSAVAGWLILNISAILIWLVVRKHRSRKARQAHAHYSQRSTYSRDYRRKEPGEVQYGVESVTLRGETVQSYSEKVIADYFFQNRIDYQYEPAVYTRTKEAEGTSRYGRRRIRLLAKPDFLLPEFDVLVEFWGLAHARDPVKRKEYTGTMEAKKAMYEHNGYRLISLYVRDLENLDYAFRQQLKEVTGLEFEKGSR